MFYTTNEMTLSALLADPLTRMVMRSDNVTLAETVEICAEARRAVLRRPRHEPRLHVTCRCPPCRSMVAGA